VWFNGGAAQAREGNKQIGTAKRASKSARRSIIIIFRQTQFVMGAQASGDVKSVGAQVAVAKSVDGIWGGWQDGVGSALRASEAEALMGRWRQAAEGGHVIKPLADLEMKARGAKQLTGGWHASSVWLLPHPTLGKLVEKRCGTAADGQKRYALEVRLLRKLTACTYVPKIIAAHPATSTIVMTYCGTQVAESLRKRSRVDRLLRDLELHHGVYRAHNRNKSQYTLENCNITELDGRLHIIDFGSPNWKSR
jgi:hypothetical protein